MSIQGVIRKKLCFQVLELAKASQARQNKRGIKNITKLLKKTKDFHYDLTWDKPPNQLKL